MQTTHVTPPETGTLVFSSDGEEIGPITQATSEYVQVKKGMIFRKEIYLPLSSIVGTALGGDGVQVNLTRDEIESGDYSAPPTSAAVEGGEHNTMGAATPGDLAASQPGTPPRDTGDTVPGGQSPDTGLHDDTDVSQRPETERHWTDDPTNRT